MEMAPEYQKMISKLEAMSDEDLVIVWESLCNHPQDPKSTYEGSLTMEDWQMHVYSEMSKRALKVT